MTNQHPITPPPELVKQWASEFYGTTIAPGEAAIYVATKCARWGADQELEACCAWVDYHCSKDASLDLSAARRPKPPSLKEQALKALTAIEGDFNTVGDRADTIRRALEALDD